MQALVLFSYLTSIFCSLSAMKLQVVMYITSQMEADW